MSHERAAPLLAAALALAPIPLRAALPPQHQNLRDLEAMVAFVRQHARVAATLRSIDLRRFVIHFGEDCEARFERQRIEHPPGWAGPQAPLVFSRATCPVD